MEEGGAAGDGHQLRQLRPPNPHREHLHPRLPERLGVLGNGNQVGTPVRDEHGHPGNPPGEGACPVPVGWVQHEPGQSQGPRGVGVAPSVTHTGQCPLEGLLIGVIVEGDGGLGGGGEGDEADAGGVGGDVEEGHHAGDEAEGVGEVGGTDAGGTVQHEDQVQVGPARCERLRVCLRVYVYVYVYVCVSICMYVCV